MVLTRTPWRERAFFHCLLTDDNYLPPTRCHGDSFLRNASLASPVALPRIVASLKVRRDQRGARPLFEMRSVTSYLNLARPQMACTVILFGQRVLRGPGHVMRPCGIMLSHYLTYSTVQCRGSTGAIQSSIHEHRVKL